ncbi:ZIP family metal transporter [[Pasteurella] aerogenes]
MTAFFLQLHPAWQALLAGLFTWFCTVIGAAFVFFFKNISTKLLDSMMGFAAGVMIAASFWSLLSPALEYAELQYDNIYWIPVAIGFLLGGLFFRFIDFMVPHLHLNETKDNAEGLKIKRKLSKSMLLFLAITIHNIPEGLAIGVSFGAVATHVEASSLSIMAAISLAIGIGVQNIPEGSSLSLPIRAEGASRMKAFTYGALSAIVEPIAAVLGALFVFSTTAILPYALAFAAGAMIFVVVEELIPESQSNGNTDIATLSLMLGFVLMMILDVSLG